MHYLIKNIKYHENNIKTSLFLQKQKKNFSIILINFLITTKTKRIKIYFAFASSDEPDDNYKAYFHYQGQDQDLFPRF